MRTLSSRYTESSGWSRLTESEGHIVAVRYIGDNVSLLLAILLPRCGHAISSIECVPSTCWVTYGRTAHTASPPVTIPAFRQREFFAASVHLAFPHETLKPKHIMNDRTHHTLCHSGFFRETHTTSAMLAHRKHDTVCFQPIWALIVSVHLASYGHARSLPLSATQRQ